MFEVMKSSGVTRHGPENKTGWLLLEFYSVFYKMTSSCCFSSLTSRVPFPRRRVFSMLLMFSTKALVEHKNVWFPESWGADIIQCRLVIGENLNLQSSNTASPRGPLLNSGTFQRVTHTEVDYICNQYSMDLNKLDQSQYPTRWAVMWRSRNYPSFSQTHSESERSHLTFITPVIVRTTCHTFGL